MIKTKHIFIIFFLVIAYIQVNANKLDSLKKSYTTETDKNKKVYTVGKIFYSIIDNYDTAYFYFKKYNVEFIKENNQFGLAYIQHMMGIVAMERSKYDTSINYFNKAIFIYKSINNDTACIPSYIFKGFDYYTLGNFDNAIQNYMIAINMAQKYNSLRNLSWAYSNLGLSLYSKPNPDYNKALNYYFKAIEMDKKRKTKFVNGLVLLRIGDTYLKLNNYSKAFYYLNYALHIGDSLKQETVIKWSLNGLGTYYKLKKDYKKALTIENQSLQLSKINSEIPGIINSYRNIADCYQQLNQLDLANQTIDSAITVSKINTIYQTLPEIYKLKSIICEKLVNDKDALKYYKLAETLSDSLFSIQNSKNINELETKYQTKQKEKEISFLNIQKEEEKNKKKILYFVLVFAIFVLILIAYFLIKVNKSKKIIQLQKYEVEKQKMLVDEKQKEILDSIKYAKRIQQAHLPTEVYITKNISKLKK